MSYRKPTKYGGHKKHRSDGYVYIYCPTHPNATKDGYVAEHVLIMEEAIGRYLTEDEIVHHKNHVRNDNRLENLELLTFKEHARLHLIERRINNQLSHYTVKVKNVTTGEVFNSTKEAAIKYGLAPTQITRVCRGKRNMVKNNKWEYVKEI